MPNTIAIVIGVGTGPAISSYGLGNLPHAEPAARLIATHARGLNYSSVTELVGSVAAYGNVDNALRKAAEALPATVLIVFSGHGFRKNPGGLCEYGSLDEHWCLHNELMVDDHLLMRTQKFAPSTRVFIVADCCFAADGSGVTGELARELLRHAAVPLPDLFAQRPKPWDSAVEAGREALRKDPSFNCSPPQAQVLFLGASGSGPSEAGFFMRAFLSALGEPDAVKSFRAFHQRLAQLGGTPVLWTNHNPLLDAPAFVP